MSALGRFLRSGEDGVILFRCPACGVAHHIQVGQGGGPRWTWDGNREAPTFSPSVRVRWNEGDVSHCCHFFVKAGRIEFCDDCTHALAGQTVKLPQFDGDEA